MSMTQRETMFVKVGGVLFALNVFFFFVLGPVRGLWNDLTAESRSKRAAFEIFEKNVNIRKGLDSKIVALEKALAVKVQKGGEGEQLRDFKKAVEMTAGKNKVKIGSFVPRKVTTRTKSTTGVAAAKRTFTITFETNQAGLLNFIKALDGIDKPVVVSTIDVQRNETQPDKLKGSLEFYTYIFDGRTS